MALSLAGPADRYATEVLRDLWKTSTTVTVRGAHWGMDGIDAAPRPAGCILDTPPTMPEHEVLRRLGEGASSVVWLVRRRKDGALFAGRVTATPDTVASSDPASSSNQASPSGGVPGADVLGTGRLGRVARAIGPLALDHLARPRGDLVATCAVPEHQHRVTLMDYLPGGSLAQVVAARGPLGPGEMVTVITPLAQLLAAGHAAGFTHGDVSPNNVLFAVDGRPVLADWDLAGLPGRPGPPGAGTDGFRDPTVGAEDRLHPASDVYALAALAWFCLTGRVPGPAEHRPPLPVLLPGAPRSLALLLDRGMDPDPEARPDAGELARGVFTVTAPEPVDLHASAHASVRPELVTRRQTPAGGRPRRRLRGGLAQGTGPVPDRRERRDHVWVLARLGRERGDGRLAVGPGPTRRDPATGTVTGSRRGLHRSALVLLVGIVVITLAGAATLLTPFGAGWFTTTPERTPGPVAPPSGIALSTPLASASASDTDPVVAARVLTETRTRVFRDGNWDRLADLTVPGSSAAAADRAAATELVAGSGRLDGLSVQLTCGQRVRAPGLPDDRALVRICARFTAYRQVDASGRVVRTVKASTGQEVQLQLARSGGRWRIELVRGTG
ncbi:protein kinase domain-containing protein [Tersicoccus phoenicis]|nr:phosphotransferase [Tersicoccus phoenicis]